MAVAMVATGQVGGEEHINMKTVNVTEKNDLFATGLSYIRSGRKKKEDWSYIDDQTAHVRCVKMMKF